MLFPKTNMMNKIVMKLGISKPLIKILLITILLMLIMYGVRKYYNIYFKNVLESYSIDQVERIVENAMEDAIEASTSSISKHLEDATDEARDALTNALNDMEERIEEANERS